jgi:hypothetical protein
MGYVVGVLELHAVSIFTVGASKVGVLCMYMILFQRVTREGEFGLVTSLGQYGQWIDNVMQRAF